MQARQKKAHRRDELTSVTAANMRAGRVRYMLTERPTAVPRKAEAVRSCAGSFSGSSSAAPMLEAMFLWAGERQWKWEREWEWGH